MKVALFVVIKLQTGNSVLCRDFVLLNLGSLWMSGFQMKKFDVKFKIIRRLPIESRLITLKWTIK